jgi:hypothetical protein
MTDFIDWLEREMTVYKERYDQLIDIHADDAAFLGAYETLRAKITSKLAANSDIFAAVDDTFTNDTRGLATRLISAWCSDDDEESWELVERIKTRLKTNQ